MKKLSLLTLALSTTLATPVTAQNVPNQCPCPQAFSGFFLGGTVGYGLGQANVKTATTVKDSFGGTMPSSSNPSLSLKGVDGGVLAGYLQRAGDWGIGVDFLANWTTTQNSQTTISSPPFFSGTTGIQSQTDFIKVSLKNAVQGRGVFSYIIANLIMPKIMLGWDNSQYALTNTSNFSSPDGGGVGVPISWATSTIGKKRLNGFLWGAGVDFLLAQNIVFGLEYTGVKSQKATFTSAANSVSGGDTIASASTVSISPQYNTFKATVRYMF